MDKSPKFPTSTLEQMTPNEESRFQDLKKTDQKIQQATQGQPLKRLKAEFALALTESEARFQVSAVNKLIDASLDAANLPKEEQEKLLASFFPDSLLLPPSSINLLKNQLETEAKRLKLAKIEFAHYLTPRLEAFLKVLIFLAKSQPALSVTAKELLHTYWSYHSHHLRNSDNLDLAFSIVELVKDQGVDEHQARLLTWTSLLSREEYEKIPYSVVLKAKHEQGRLILDEEFWVEFAQQDIDEALSFFYLAQGKNNQALEIENAALVHPWLQLNYYFGFFKRLDGEAAPIFFRPSQFNANELSLTYHENKLLSVKIAKKLWQAQPELWPLIAEGRISLELNEVERRLWPLLTTLLKDADELSVEKWEEAAQIIIPLTQEGIAHLKRMFPISDEDFIYASEKFPELFEPNVKAHLIESNKDASETQVALLRLAAQLNFSKTEAQVFVESLENLVDAVITSPLKVVFKSNPNQHLSGHTSRFVNQKSDLWRQKIDQGVIVIRQAETSDTVPPPIKGDRELIQAIGGGSLDWSTLPIILERMHSGRQRHMRGTVDHFPESSSYLLALFLRQHSAELVQNEQLQRICQLLAELTINANVSLNLVAAPSEVEILLKETDVIVKLFRQINTLKQLSMLTSLGIKIQTNKFQPDSVRRYSSDEFLQFMQSLESVQAELGDVSEDALVQLLLSSEVDNAQDAAPGERPSFVLSQSTIEKSLVKHPLPTLKFLTKVLPESISISKEVPPYLTTEMMRGWLRTYDELDIPEPLKEALFKDFFAHLALPQDREVLLSPNATNDQIMSILWPDYRTQSIKNDTSQTDYLTLFTGYQRWLRALGLFKGPLSTNRLIDQLSANTAEPIKEVIAANPALLESILSVNSGSGIWSLNEEQIRQHWQESTDKANQLISKKELVFVLGQVLSMPDLQIQLSPLTHAILRLRSIYQNVKSYALVQTMEVMFEEALEVPEQFISLFHLDSSYPRLTYGGMQRVMTKSAELIRGSTSLVEDLHQSGLFVMEPQQFENIQEFLFFQDLLDSQLNIFQEPHDLEAMLRNLGATNDGSVLNRLVATIPSFKKGVIDSLNAGFSFNSYAKIYLSYAPMQMVMSMVMSETGLNERQAEFLSTKLLSTTEPSQELLKRVVHFSSDAQLTPYLESLPVLLDELPEVIFVGDSINLLRTLVLVHGPERAVTVALEVSKLLSAFKETNTDFPSVVWVNLFRILAALEPSLVSRLTTEPTMAQAIFTLFVEFGVGEMTQVNQLLSKVMTELRVGTVSSLEHFIIFCTKPEFAPYKDKRTFFLENVPELVLSAAGQEKLLKYEAKFISITSPEELKKVVALIKRVENSSSTTVRRLAETFIESVINHPNPEEALGYIETIFQINPHYFPTTAELVLFTKLQYQGVEAAQILKYSPTFKDLDSRQKFFWISLIMIRNHIQSDSRWLQMYIKEVETAQPLLEKYLMAEELTEAESQQLRNMLRGWMILRELKTIVRSKELDLTFLDHLGNYDALSTQELINQLLNDFNLPREGTSATQVLDVVAQRFAGFIGVSNWKELKQRGSSTRDRATTRNRAITSLDYFKGKTFIAKSFNTDYFEDAIAEYGFQSKEFFKAESDATPGDVDARELHDFELAKMEHLINSYGDVVALVEDTGQFLRTQNSDVTTAKKRKDQLLKMATNQYELFPVQIDGADHVGISVGLPITEVSAYIVKTDIALKNLSFSLARKGLYTPIFSEKGELIFSYEEFENLKHIFDGVNEFSEVPPSFTTQMNAAYYPEVQRLIQSKFSPNESGISDNEFILQANHNIQQGIQDVLTSLGIKTDTAHSLTVNGAAVLNTGSSGRLTNVPGDYDFDLMVLIDQADWDLYADALYEKLRARWPSSQDASHSEGDRNYFLVKLLEAEIGDGAKVDLDISIKLKSTYSYPASHEVIEQKLSSIKTEYGDNAYQEVIATVLFTKQLLKHYGAYKEGLKGIGTENWLLAHGGNLRDACGDFAKAAFGTDNSTDIAALKPISLEEFKRKYGFLDAGINLKDMRHDRYFSRLTEEAYQGMCRMAKDVLAGTIPPLQS